MTRWLGRATAMRGLVLMWLAGALAACSFETTDGTVESANEALAAGKVDEAVAAYAAAAQRIPESPPLNFDRGVAASLAGDHEGAASFLLQALATKDKVLEQKVKSAIGTAYARHASMLERTPQPAADPGAPAPEPADATPKISEAAMSKWKLAVEFLEEALILDPRDLEARRSLEVALLRVDPPCATRDDKFEDNDNAGSAKAIEVKVEAPNQSQDPSLAADSEAAKDVLRAREQLFSCPDDDDWYALELAAGDRVELSPTVPKDAGSLAFALLAPDGRTAWQWTSPRALKGASSDADALPTHRFAVPPEAAGRWLLQVKNIDVDEVSYGLEVVVRPACSKVEDRYEDNDSAAEARQLTPGPVPDLKRCPGDEDWYAVTLAEGESLFLYAQPDGKPDEQAKPPEGAPPPPPPFRVEVLDALGSVRARAAPIDKSQVSTLLMPGAGRYYVRVFDAATNGAEPYEGRYSLQVEIVPPCPEGDDRFEDNDDAASATDLIEAATPPPAEGGAPQQQQGPPVVFARVCPGDVDWWKLTSDGSKPEIVSLVFDHAQGDLSLELLDEPGTTNLASSDTSSAEQNGEALPLPMAAPAPAATPPGTPGAAPTAPGTPDRAEPAPPPKVYKLRVAAKGDAQNFYLLRLDQPSGGGGDEGDSGDEGEPKESEDQADKPPKDPGDKDEPADSKDKPKSDKEQANPLQDALDNLDRNPENLPARDAARKSPLANQKPLKDW